MKIELNIPDSDEPIENPVSLINQAITVVTLIRKVIQSDLEIRQKQLQEIRYAKTKLEEELLELKLEQHFYALQRDQVDAPPGTGTANEPDATLSISPIGLSALELARTYDVSDKTIQNWVKVVKAAYCWLPEEDLHRGTSNQIRYTPLCQRLIAEFRASGLGRDLWIEQIHAENPTRASLHSEDS